MMGGMGVSDQIAPDAHTMGHAILREAGPELSDAEIRDAIQRHGWAAYGPWATNVIATYRVAERPDHIPF